MHTETHTREWQQQRWRLYLSLMLHFYSLLDRMEGTDGIKDLNQPIYRLITLQNSHADWREFHGHLMADLSIWMSIFASITGLP